MKAFLLKSPNMTKEQTKERLCELQIYNFGKEINYESKNKRNRKNC